MEKDAGNLAELIRSATERSLGVAENLGLMFSGGVDSAVLAVIARKYCDVTLYIAGMEDSHDLKWGRECASILDLPQVSIVLQEEDVIQAMQNVVKRGMTNPKWMSTFVAFDLVLRNVREKHVMCGQGADELFGGYMKYGQMADPVSCMNDGVRELVASEMPGYRKMAAHYDKILLAPYLDDEIISFANAIPTSCKFNESENKIILRKAAEVLCVPNMMAYRKKKAMQYGTGISKIMKRHFKMSGMPLEMFINNNQI